MDFSIFIEQLDNLLTIHKGMQGRSQHNDLSDLPKLDRQSLVTRSIVAIRRISGANSIYNSEVERIIKQTPQLHVHTSPILGIVQALRDDIKDGFLQNLSEIVHAEIFSDFLDMAKHLNDAGYKDPAAVIAGSTLESHLKKLAAKNGVPTEIGDKPVKAEKLNQDLAKATAYGILDQKAITAFLDLRNKAAHGNYADYSTEQVKNLISGITDFIIRNPA